MTKADFQKLADMRARQAGKQAARWQAGRSDHLCASNGRKINHSSRLTREKALNHEQSLFAWVVCSGVKTKAFHPD
jgi:hypothetical protein